jgi:hypothetical protein
MFIPHCDGKVGFVDYTGKLVVPARYEFANRFSEGLSAVKMNGKWGFINKKGDFQIAPTFDALGSFSSGLAPAAQGDKYGYIDQSGRWVFSVALTVPQGVSPLKMMGAFLGDLALVIVVEQLPTPHVAMEYVDRTGKIVYGPTPAS